jgi:hypothetical protein
MQQVFLDAHERAFAYFGGVFRTLRYDNLNVGLNICIEPDFAAAATQSVKVRT